MKTEYLLQREVDQVLSVLTDKNRPHSARKVYAVQLLEEYGDIQRVRRALNHSSEAVTLIYAMADKNLKSKKRRRAKPGRRKV